MSTNSHLFFQCPCRLTPASHCCPKLAATLLHHWKSRMKQRLAYFLEGLWQVLGDRDRKNEPNTWWGWPLKTISLQLDIPAQPLLKLPQILCGSLLLWKALSTCSNFVTSTSWLFWGGRSPFYFLLSGNFSNHDKVRWLNVLMSFFFFFGFHVWCFFFFFLFLPKKGLVLTIFTALYSQHPRNDSHHAGELQCQRFFSLQVFQQLWLECSRKSDLSVMMKSLKSYRAHIVKLCQDLCFVVISY